MNTKQKLTKWTSITLLVAIASLATAGLVFAEHEIPIGGGAATYSWASFKQYDAALDQADASQTTSWTWVERYNQAFGKLGR